MRRLAPRIATACLSLLCLLPSRAPAQAPAGHTPPTPQATTTPEPVEDPGEVVRINTSLVTVPVRVMDQSGKYIPDMRSEEFRVFEDGVEQEVAFFAPVNSPFTIVLMLDISDSTESSLKEIKQAALSLIAQLRPEDSVIVVTFAGGISVLGQPTNDHEALRAMIEGIRPGGGTRLYDAVKAVLKLLIPQIKGRTAVVLFTDGADINSRATASQTLHEAEETEALVYTVRYDTYAAVSEKLKEVNSSAPAGIFSTNSLRKEDYTLGRLYLRGLADKTGARMYEASSPLKLAAAFALIAEELRWQYSLGYYPRGPGQPGQSRKIKVRVSRPKLAVRARDSYIYRPPTEPPDSSPRK
jgi:Ca-activated chloride channel homolog